MKQYKEIETEKSKETIKRTVISMSVLILIGITVLIGTSYALFSTTLHGEKQVSIQTGTFEVEMTDGEYIKEESIGTMTDKEGKKTKPYTFTITNTSTETIGAYYKLYLTEESGNLNTYYLKYELKGTDGSQQEGRIGILNCFYWSKYLEAKESVTYELRLWLDEETPNSEQGKNYQSKIAVEGSQVSTGGPVLSDNMIPVIYNEGKGKWVTTTDKDSNWYDYNNQKWANAITVKEDVREEYKRGGKEFDADSDDILTMFVWIPRYSYTIKQPYGKGGKSAAIPGEIDVKFIDVDEKDNGSAQYTLGSPSEWYTPPGFTFGKKELSGVWIGKFETGYMDAATVLAARRDTEELNKVIIKPNVYSWTGIRVSTLELVSMGITSGGNIYGFDQTTYDSHAAKNTEWALISYLTQSKYGKYGNSLYTGTNKEVYINNYNEFMAGCSSGRVDATLSEICTYRYNDLTILGEGTGYVGAGASSTGNIYGIYDVNGGSWEYVLGDYAPNGIRYTGRFNNSGYTGLMDDGNPFTGRDWKEDKYYDFYSSTNTTTACTVDGNKNSPCKGHAMNEVMGWYSDVCNMLGKTVPWVLRGGLYNENKFSGIFQFNNSGGFANGDRSFRIILTPR